MDGRRRGLDHRTLFPHDGDRVALLARDNAFNLVRVGAICQYDDIAPHGTSEGVRETVHLRTMSPRYGGRNDRICAFSCHSTVKQVWKLNICMKPVARLGLFNFCSPTMNS